MTEAEREFLAQSIRRPSVFGETVLVNRDGSPRKFRPYQIEDLDCLHHQIVHLDGRDVGKTIDISAIILWFAFMHPGQALLMAAPLQGHLDTIIEEIEFQIEYSRFIADAVAVSKHGPRIVRKPYYKIHWKNGHITHFRPAGATGNSFRSLHVEYVIVDEAAYMTEPPWRALRRCLKKSGVFRAYSTPNGIRDTTYHRITESPTWHLFHWPSWISPEWDEQQERELVDYYGGKDSPGWQHEIAGEHGAPAFGAFNPQHVLRALSSIPDYRKIELTGEVLDGCDSESAIRDRLESVLALSSDGGTFWVGGDLGYTRDPCELLVYRETETGLDLELRIHTERVPYPAISEILSIMDDAYHPVGIGVDQGGNGISVLQDLLTLDKFKRHNFKQRLVGYDFGGSIETGVPGKDGEKTIKERTKVAMTAVINERLNARAIRWPKSDTAIEDQFMGQTYSMTQSGLVYSKGNDHIVDATRCAVLRWHQANRRPSDERKLKARFVFGSTNRSLT